MKIDTNWEIYEKTRNSQGKIIQFEICELLIICAGLIIFKGCNFEQLRN